MKAFYNRAPLSANQNANLDAGKIRPGGWLRELLSPLAERIAGAYDECVAKADTQQKAALAARALNALMVTAYALDEEQLRAKAVSEIEKLLRAQEEDGGFAFCGYSDYLTRMRAANAMYLYLGASGDKRALLFLDAFLKYEYRNLSAKPLEDKACAQASDNIYLALKLYNITGQKYLLKLCEILKGQMLDWTNLFSTFPNIQPMSKSMSVSRLREGMEGEKNGLKGENHPFFASYYHQTLGENVGNALKAPGVVSLFKSGFKELNGFKYGWEKLIKYHGTSAGMFTCDGHLNGTNPSQGIDLSAAGETVRSLLTLLDCGSFGPELIDILEKLAFNVLPAAVDLTGGLTQALQQTNQLNIDSGAHGWYNAPESANVFARDTMRGDLFAAAGALSSFAAGLWQATADGGLSAVSYAPCTVSHVIDGTQVRLTVDTNYPFEDSIKIGVDTMKPIEFPLYLRIPSWAVNPMIHLPDGEIMSVRAGETACVRQRWTSDCEIRLVLPMTCRLSRLSRQSAAVELGPLLMALPLKGQETRGKDEAGRETLRVRLDGEWACALETQQGMKPIRPEGEQADLHSRKGLPKALVKLGKTPLWEKAGSDAGAIPILPVCREEDMFEAELVPYGATKLRIAQFPIAKTEENNA